MEVWCRRRIPVEGNFGQTYDSLNQSIHDLEGDFSATIELKEEKQAAVLGLNRSWEHVSTELRDYVRHQEARLEWALGLLHVLFSCTFLLVLRASFSYTDSYNGDIRFDNIYISTYFRQIDERRKKLGKRTLLALRKAEEKTVIFPCNPSVQASEMRNVVRELAEMLPVLLLLLLLCGLDWALYSIFDTIRHHSFLQYSFRTKRAGTGRTRPERTPGAMRLLPLLRTVLWAALLSSPLRGGSGLRHAVYWNSSNPRLLGGDGLVELDLNDYLDIFCPHYEGPGPPDGPETFALYMVDRPGYEACQAQGPGAFKRWECALPFAPFGPVRFSEKIQRFTPFSLGFEFLPGETYYYISVPTPESSGKCLRLQVSVCCKESRSESAHPVGSPGESGTSGWQGGGALSPLCLLLLLLLPILRLLRVL